MGFGLRDEERYGLFKANSDKGEVEINISIYGFGERIIVTKDKETLYDIDTLEDESEDYYDENEEYLEVGDVKVIKPFIKCLKRY